MKKTISVLMVTILFIACKKSETDSDINSKDIETIIYKIDSFDAITNKSAVNIEITDEVPKDEIHFTASKKNIENIKREVSNGNLIISDNNKTKIFDNNFDIVAKINSDNISSFTISGTGYMKSKLVQKATNIEIVISGAGDLNLTVYNKKISNIISGIGNIDLKGNTEQMQTKISGAGNLEAFELKTAQSINIISGIGNANVYVTDKLTVDISGVGDLSYKGNPKEIRKTISGLGSVNQQ